MSFKMKAIIKEAVYLDSNTFVDMFKVVLKGDDSGFEKTIKLKKAGSSWSTSGVAVRMEYLDGDCIITFEDGKSIRLDIAQIGDLRTMLNAFATMEDERRGQKGCVFGREKLVWKKK